MEQPVLYSVCLDPGGPAGWFGRRDPGFPGLRINAPLGATRGCSMASLPHITALSPALPLCSPPLLQLLPPRSAPLPKSACRSPPVPPLSEHTSSRKIDWPPRRPQLRSSALPSRRELPGPRCHRGTGEWQKGEEWHSGTTCSGVAPGRGGTLGCSCGVAAARPRRIYCCFSLENFSSPGSLWGFYPVSWWISAGCPGPGC